jgi:hypothetical protein
VREKFAQWLAETHGAGFELVRHFFLRFFDSDLITTPGQLEALMIGVFSSLASFGFLLPYRLYRKYFDLSLLDTGDLYHQAVLADKLFFIAFSMAVIGIIVALEWHSLFPSVRDSLVLTPLPVTLRQVFGAKFLALILFVSLFIFAVNFLSSLMFPAMVAGKWQMPPVGMRYVLAHAVASGAAAYFVFFSLVGCAGVLMNVLSARLFQKVSLYLQTLVLLLLLCILPLLFYIPNFDQQLASRPDLVSKLPPLWFLGLSQVLQGNSNAYFDALARRALIALAVAFTATLALYFISYRRQASRLPSSSGERMTQRGTLISTVLNKLLPDVQQRAAFSFIGKTLNRSRHHKLLLAGYVGIGLALVVDGFVTLLLERQFRRIDWQQTRWLQAVLSAPMVFSFFLLSGMRYVFSIPVELRANWIFRVTETDARARLLDGVEKVVLTFGIAPILILMLPIHVWLLGGAAAAVHFVEGGLLSLILMELVLFDFEKVPFTCSYLPGKRNVTQTLVLYWVAFSAYAYSMTGIEVWSLYDPARVLTVVGLLLAAFCRLRRARKEHWGHLPLLFDDVPEPLIQKLGLQTE